MSQAMIASGLMRRALAFALGAILTCVLAFDALAQPTSRRMTIIVPYATGGGTDVIARLLADHMSRTLQQNIVVENVSGGSGAVGSARTAQSAPDGTTVLINQLPLVAGPFLMAGLAYDTQTAFTPVGLINAGYPVLVARKGLARTPEEVVAWLRTNGNHANIGNGGFGGSGHFCELLLLKALEIRPTLVSYRGGGPALNDVLAGALDLVCDQSTALVPQIQAGSVQGVLVAGPNRIASIPEVPAAAELGLPQVNLAVWHGLYVPRATPRPIIDRLNGALRAALSDPAIVERFAQLGTTVYPESQRSPEAHEALFQSEYERLGQLLTSMGITPQTVQ